MRTEPAFALQAVHVEVVTDGLVLTLDIEHRYQNRSANPVEAIYTFPVPHDAVILAVEADRDNQALPVNLRDMTSAEDAYETAQAERAFAALIHRPAPGLCTTNLGVLLPGTKARLLMRFGRFLEVVGGSARIVVPSIATMPEGSHRAASAGSLGVPIASVLAEYPLTARFTLLGAAAAAEATSPSHALENSRSWDAVVFTLTEPAALDRDIVVTLVGLPAEDGGWIAVAGTILAVAATTPPTADNRFAMNAVMLVDAASWTNPVAGGLIDILGVLADELEPDDRLSVARIGRTLLPDPPALVTTGGLDIALLERDVSALGDFTPDALPPSFDLPPGADICLVTDGRSRVSEWIVERASADGRRLFVLGVGSAPDAGWLHPAALATGGDYVGLSSREALEPATHRLLGALTLPPIVRPSARWSGSPIWNDGPASWRTGVRAIVCATFEKDASEEITLDFEQDWPGLALAQRSGHGDLALAAARVAAAQRLPSLEHKDRAEWSRRFAVAAPGTAWVAEARRDGVGAVLGSRLEVLPQMVAAGWRGVGRPAPVPPPSASPLPPPQARPIQARKPSRLPLVAAALIVVAAAGVGAWEGWRSPSMPASAPSDRFPTGSGKRLPIKQPSAADQPPGKRGADPDGRPSTRSLGALAGSIIMVIVAAGVLTLWLRGGRRRRG